MRLLQPDAEGRPTRASPIITEIDTQTIEGVLEMNRPSVISLSGPEADDESNDE